MDTGAIVSAVPARWLTEGPKLHRFLESVSAPMSFATIAGVGEGPVARDIQVRFLGHPDLFYPVDFLVSPGLDSRDYGLIALRDIVRHFFVEMEGPIRFAESGAPLELPNLVLAPYAVGVRVRDRCPNASCQRDVRGRPGLHLICGDCNQRMVPQS